MPIEINMELANTTTTTTTKYNNNTVIEILIMLSIHESTNNGVIFSGDLIFFPKYIATHKVFSLLIKKKPKLPLVFN